MLKSTVQDAFASGVVALLPFPPACSRKLAPHVHALQVLGEDLVLVKGQQERMGAGADVWAHPVAYDKLGVRCALC